MVLLKVFREVAQGSGVVTRVALLVEVDEPHIPLASHAHPPYFCLVICWNFLYVFHLLLSLS